MAFEFGPLLRVYRAFWNITQKDMAALLYMSQSAYSRIETGEQSLSPKALEKVADRCGVSIHTLIMAHLLLDENLAAIDQNTVDPAQKTLVKLAEEFSKHYPAPLKDAAALGLLLAGAPDDERREQPIKTRGER
ncbi:MAG: helix-turn-helix transcriptional regulator [Marinicaulis sp.]|nr:helix-turn-helix transcriptional regulator [Marinicaulis sp.]NNL87607.1 helix-turn-helix transcriptional regulator [Marinicaulis sp.]